MKVMGSDTVSDFMILWVNSTHYCLSFFYCSQRFLCSCLPVISLAGTISYNIYSFFDLLTTDRTLFIKFLCSNIFNVFVNVCCGMFVDSLMSRVHTPLNT